MLSHEKAPLSRLHIVLQIGSGLLEGEVADTWTREEATAARARARRYVNELNATLTIDLSRADVIVFRGGRSCVLRTAISRGTPVLVTPEWLNACHKQRSRVPYAPYRLLCEETVANTVLDVPISRPHRSEPPTALTQRAPQSGEQADILHGVQIVLQVGGAQNEPSLQEQRHIRARARLLVYKLGACLTVQLEKADVVVFAAGRDRVLSLASVRRLPVVTPAWLQSCHDEGRRVPWEPFVLGEAPPLNPSGGTKTSKTDNIVVPTTAATDTPWNTVVATSGTTGYEPPAFSHDEDEPCNNRPNGAVFEAPAAAVKLQPAAILGVVNSEAAQKWVFCFAGFHDSVASEAIVAQCSLLGCIVVDRCFGKRRKPTHVIVPDVDTDSNSLVERDARRFHGNLAENATCLYALASGIPLVRAAWIAAAYEAGGVWPDLYRTESTFTSPPFLHPLFDAAFYSGRKWPMRSMLSGVSVCIAATNRRLRNYAGLTVPMFEELVDLLGGMLLVGDVRKRGREAKCSLPVQVSTTWLVDTIVHHRRPSLPVECAAVHIRD